MVFNHFSLLFLQASISALVTASAAWAHQHLALLPAAAGASVLLPPQFAWHDAGEAAPAEGRPMTQALRNNFTTPP